MQNWEYKTLSFMNDKGLSGARECDPQTLDTQLNQWGQQNWELVNLVGVSTQGTTFQMVATLKRERK